MSYVFSFRLSQIIFEAKYCRFVYAYFYSPETDLTKVSHNPIADGSKRKSKSCDQAYALISKQKKLILLTEYFKVPFDKLSCQVDQHIHQNGH